MVQRTGQVQHQAGSYRRLGGGIVLFRAVLLPFRGTREEWSYVLGAVTYRIDAEARPPVEPAEEGGEELIQHRPAAAPPVGK